MAQVLGIVDIIWKGATLEIEKGASIKLGGIRNKGVTAGRKGHRSQEFQMSEVKAAVLFKKGDVLTTLLDAAEGELQFVCDTGQTMVMPEAFLVDAPTLTGGEGGKLDLTWNASE